MLLLLSCSLLLKVLSLPLAYIVYPSPLQFFVDDSVVIKPTDIFGSLKYLEAQSSMLPEGIEMNTTDFSLVGRLEEPDAASSIFLTFNDTSSGRIFSVDLFVSGMSRGSSFYYKPVVCIQSQNCSASPQLFGVRPDRFYFLINYACWGFHVFRLNSSNFRSTCH